MWLYITLMIIPSVYSVLSVSKNIKSSTFFCLGFSIILFFILGLRHKVGGDWLNYLFIYENINDYFNPISLNFLESDYLYDLINWIAFNNSLGFVSVNLANTMIFIIGLYFFASKQLQPSMVYLVAVPYLIIVVSTGYVRQASALAFFLIGIHYLINKNYFTYVILIIVGSLFHKTLFGLLILVPLMQFRFLSNFFNLNRVNINYLALIILLIFISIIFFNYFLKFQYYFVIRNYIGIDQHFTSTGAIYRIIIFLMAAVICLIFNKSITDNDDERKFYLLISTFIVISSPLVIMYSSAVDRVLIYCYPLQLFIFSRLHLIFADHKHRIFYNIIVIFMFIGIFLFWANYAKFSKHWIPYKNILFI